ncbi:MAG TPA: hypothetical protein DCM07_13105 [Planctomycetaceae bacterium]|nr:hypothetical protein [Gimesia sp.]HAH45765.1 hypothetical protein [Planctomycetaceae bacterium]HBL46863.1 hypothetical protein [Planctomycetaceae bacterium]|tara:strand:- start:427 stop:621 length:195 start_codon:yes stop_codon:yes gene_type:complete
MTPDSKTQVENTLPEKQKETSVEAGKQTQGPVLNRGNVFTAFPVGREFSFKSVYIPGCHSPKIS